MIRIENKWHNLTVDHMTTWVWYHVSFLLHKFGGKFEEAILQKLMLVSNYDASSINMQSKTSLICSPQRACPNLRKPHFFLDRIFLYHWPNNKQNNRKLKCMQA